MKRTEWLGLLGLASADFEAVQLGRLWVWGMVFDILAESKWLRRRVYARRTVIIR